VKTDGKGEKNKSRTLKKSKAEPLKTIKEESSIDSSSSSASQERPAMPDLIHSEIANLKKNPVLNSLQIRTYYFNFSQHSKSLKDAVKVFEDDEAKQLLD
jgi:hypothetical protein